MGGGEVVSRTGSVGPESPEPSRSTDNPRTAPMDGTVFESARQDALRKAGAVPRGSDAGGMATDMPPPGAGEHARLRWAAEQLESLLLYELLKSARGTVMKTGLLDSQATKMFEDMLDEERAAQMARSGGMGLAELIYEQMSRHLPPADEQEGKGRK